MNELMTNDELMLAVRDVEKREASLMTVEGQKRAAGMMLDVLRMIESAGYTPKADPVDMAMVWVMAMREQIAAYRFEVIREAAMEFITKDASEYKMFPSAGQIIDICNRMGKNPRAELARRKAAERVADIEQERADELAALPEGYKAECMRKFEHLWKGKA